MTALIIIGIIALLITLIMLIPIGADVGYEGGELSVSAKACGMLIKLFPKPPEDGTKPPKHPKKEKKPKKKKSAEQPEGEEESKPKKKLDLNFTPDELLALLKKVLKGFGKLGRKFKVDRFLLRFTAAGDDPYNTAMMYAYVNSALASLGPLCEKRFAVKDCEVATGVDFTADKLSIDLGLAVTIRIGQIFGAVNTIVFGALGILIKNKLRLMKEKRQNKAEAVLEAPPAET